MLTLISLIVAITPAPAPEAMLTVVDGRPVLAVLAETPRWANPDDMVYVLTDATGDQKAAIMVGNTVASAWTCTCVGTGGTGGVCPHLTDCPPQNCSAAGGHAACAMVFHPGKAGTVRPSQPRQ